MSSWFKMDRAALKRTCVEIGVEEEETEDKKKKDLLKLAVLKLCMLFFLPFCVCLSGE